MTTQQDIANFHEHVLWSRLDQIKEAIASAHPRASDDRATLARCEAIVSYVAEFRSLPGGLFPSTRIAAASQLDNFLSSIWAQLEGWDQTGAMTPTTVQQIDSLCDSVLATISGNSWPPLLKESRAAAIKAAAEAYVHQSEASLETLETNVSAANATLDAITESVTELSDEAKARATQAKEAGATLAAFIASSDSAAKEALAARMSSIDAETKAHREWLDGQAAEFLASLKRDAKTGEELVNKVGDQEYAGGYETFATKELTAYRLWNVVGIVLVVVALIYLAVLLQEVRSLPIQLVVVRTALSATAVGASAYAFRQASKRLRQSVEAKYRALDLLALRPFTNSMELKEQTALRTLLGQRLFGNPVDDRRVQTSETSPATLDISVVSQIVTEVIKQMPK